MTYLVYCIFRGNRERLPRVPGIDGKSVRYTGGDEIIAALTELPEGIAPDVSILSSYEAVVEAIFSEFTLIPVRFGNYFENLEKLEKLLVENAAELARILDDLKGSSEMGIRVLAATAHPGESESGILGSGTAREAGFAGSPGSFRSDDGPAEKQAISTSASGTPLSGKEYLKRRKLHYQTTAGISEWQKEVVSRLRATFDGLYTRLKSEEPAMHSGTISTGASDLKDSWKLFLSVYFLVPDNLIESFRLRFSTLRIEGFKFLLTGPWPPYNFSDFKPAESGKSQ